MKNIKTNSFIQKVLSLNLPIEDFAIMGSGCLFAHGFKDLNKDIDLIARGKAWEKAKTLGHVEKMRSSVGEVVELFDGMVEIFSQWAPGEWNIDELIDSAEMIEGLRFVTLDKVLKWKKTRSLPKDLGHIKLIEEYLIKKK